MLEYDLSLALPYYLNFDAQATLGVDFSVEMPMAIELSQNPSFSVTTPQVSVSRSLTGSAKAAMQIGAIVHLERRRSPRCAPGPMCAGPWVDVKQDAYVGRRRVGPSQTARRATANSSPRGRIHFHILRRIKRNAPAP